jgi:hypothetical protein
MASGRGQTKAKMATDANGTQIQGALRPKPGASQNVTVVAANTVSTKLVDAGGVPYEIVRLLSTVDAYVRFGDFATVAAAVADMYLKASMAEYFSLRGMSYIAVIRIGGADGILNIQVMD